MKKDDIAYIFEHSEADIIIADAEFEPLLEAYRAAHPDVTILVDTDTDATAGELSGPFDAAVLEGLRHDQDTGAKGWNGLEAQAANEDDVVALAYTSGTTARPKGVEFTHRGCYLAALANIIESGLNVAAGRCRYLWTLPMFHATGKRFRVPARSLLILFRMDIPLVDHCCERNTLLSSQNRLSCGLAHAEGGTNHSFQRCPNCEYSTVQF